MEMSSEEVPSYENITPNNLPTLMHEAHGLLLWNQERQKWRGGKKAVIRSKKKWRLLKLRTLCLCIAKRFCCGGNAAFDKLLSKNKPFPRRMPLHEMVDFLVDIWEQEGLYD